MFTQEGNYKGTKITLKGFLGSMPKEGQIWKGVPSPGWDSDLIGEGVVEAHQRAESFAVLTRPQLSIVTGQARLDVLRGPVRLRLVDGGTVAPLQM